MSRFRFLVLLAALTALVSALAACGGAGGSDAQQVLDNATLEGVDSGDLDLALSVKSEGDDAGNVDIRLSGPFQTQGKDDLPLLALQATVKGEADGEDVDFDGGITVLSDRAFVGYKGTEYEVDPTTYGFLKSGFEQTQQKGEKDGDGDGATACQDAAAGLELGNFVENLSSEGGEDVDGTSTTRVSGDLDAGGAIDALIELLEDPACASQAEAAGPLPIEDLEDAKSEVEGAVKKAHAEVYVGDDDIVRRLVAELTIEPKDKDKGKVEVDLDLTLSGVNEDQDISGPANAEPLEDLFAELGVNPLELLEAGESGDIEGLLEGLLEGATGNSSPGGSSDGGGSPLGGLGADDSAYLECLEKVETAADIQQCAKLEA